METINITDSTLILANNAGNVYNNVEDISATTQQLSVGMKETAASAQEIGSNSFNFS